MLSTRRPLWIIASLLLGLFSLSATAAQLLKQLLAENSAKTRGLTGDRLLVLTALQLCQQQVAMQDKHAADIRALEAHVDARLSDIAGLMAQG